MQIWFLGFPFLYTVVDFTPAHRHPIQHCGILSLYEESGMAKKWPELERRPLSTSGWRPNENFARLSMLRRGVETSILWPNTNILDQIAIVLEADHTGALSDFAFGSH